MCIRSTLKEKSFAPVILEMKLILMNIVADRIMTNYIQISSIIDRKQIWNLLYWLEQEFWIF